MRWFLLAIFWLLLWSLNPELEWWMWTVIVLNLAVGVITPERRYTND